MELNAELYVECTPVYGFFGILLKLKLNLIILSTWSCLKIRIQDEIII